MKRRILGAVTYVLLVSMATVASAQPPPQNQPTPPPVGQPAQPQQPALEPAPTTPTEPALYPPPEPEPEPEPEPYAPPEPQPMETPEPEARREVEQEVAEEAEEAAPLPKIGGFVETAYHINLSDTDVENPVLTRSYDPPGNAFVLHAAHLVVSHAFTDEISATMEIDAGRDAAVNTATDASFTFDVQEAYVTWASQYGFTLTAGKFVTYEGIEVIEGPMNPTITRGFLFGLAEPFTHTGAKVHYNFSGVVDVGVGLVNGWDQFLDNNNGKTLIARIGVTPVEQFFIALSGSFGPEQEDNSSDDRLSLDLTGSITPMENLVIWFQANYGSEEFEGEDASWYGFGIQPVVTFGEFFAGLRVEFFNDVDGSRVGFEDTNYTNITLTPGYKISEALAFRAEYRVDFASEDVLSEEESNQHTLAFSGHYIF